MLWNNQNTYLDEPFASESELESAIREVAPQLFGPTRLYLDIKRRIGIRGRTQNVPDGYLIDLSSNKEPKLFVVENELSEHDPLKHVAVQVLEFSLSFETTPHVVKTIVKEALAHDAEAMSKCQTYASVNGFENVDYLLWYCPAFSDTWIRYGSPHEEADLHPRVQGTSGQAELRR